jgi:hypothetical protein
MRSLFCVSVYTLYQFLSARTNLYEISYVYHGTWAHLNGLLHKSLSSVCMYMFPLIIARQRLFKNVTSATNTHVTIEELLDTSFSLQSVSY